MTRSPQDGLEASGRPVKEEIAGVVAHWIPRKERTSVSEFRTGPKNGNQAEMRLTVTASELLSGSGSTWMTRAACSVPSRQGELSGTANEMRSASPGE